jgi:hypothetical protein
MRPLACMDCGFESLWWHGSLSFVRVCVSDRGLCDGPIPRSEESYRVCMYVCVCVVSCVIKCNSNRQHLKQVGRRGQTKKERKKERRKKERKKERKGIF